MATNQAAIDAASKIVELSGSSLSVEAVAAIIAQAMERDSRKRLIELAAKEYEGQN